jgi:tetratricopeptide (TPR) repeat protein
MDSRAVLARFEAERQALAFMDHPSIATVLDGGTTTGGRPYFVMELVEGQPITAYCDTHRLGIPERIELLIQVCHAVQHAHQKGIIHRDLKPSNLLVTDADGRPLPKVIDFGLAKALDTSTRLSDHSFLTAHGAALGTPLYMAPEQLAPGNSDTDTRADLFSLGVILYELLTGTTPLEKRLYRDSPWPELERGIRERDAERPSLRLSSSTALPDLAAARRAEPEQLVRSVRGDLDWIVLKALEKDRARRYPTATSLAEDLRRHLSGEPVGAAPPSLRYRAYKFLRKHRGAAVAATLIFTTLLLGVAGTTWGLVRAEGHRRTAVTRQIAALAAAAKESEARKREAAETKRAHQAHERAMAALRATTDEVVERLIGARANLGANERAFLERTLERWQTFAEEQGDQPQARATRAEGLFRVAKLRHMLGENDQAVAGYRSAIALYEPLVAEQPGAPDLGQGLARAYNNLASLLWDLGQQSEAKTVSRSAIDLKRALVAKHPGDPSYRQSLATSLNNLANYCRALKRFDESIAHYDAALELQQTLASEHPDVPAYRHELARTQNNLGNLLSGLKQHTRAEELLRSAIGLQQSLAAEFPGVPTYRRELAGSYNNLGTLLKARARLPDGEASYAAAVDTLEQLVAETPGVPAYRLELAGCSYNLGQFVLDDSRPGDSLPRLTRAIEILTPAIANEPRFQAARSLLRDAHAARAQALGALERYGDAVKDWDVAISLTPPERQDVYKAKRQADATHIQ